MDESTLHTPSTSSFDSSQTSRASSSTPVLLKGFPDQTHRTSLVRFLPPSSAPIPSPTTPTYSFQSVKRNRRRSTDLFSSVILEEPGDTVEPGSSGFERRKRASMYGTGTGIGREEGKGRERLTLLELLVELLFCPSTCDIRFTLNDKPFPFCTSVSHNTSYFTRPNNQTRSYIISKSIRM
jgi:hypothetical protein